MDSVLPRIESVAFALAVSFDVQCDAGDSRQVEGDSVEVAAERAENPVGGHGLSSGVRWFKGLEPDELEPLIAGLTGEIVIHFRWASVGEVTPKLCHSFPVTSRATTRLSGHARAVLFHNGTWSQWRETLRRMPRHRMPDGLLSDTRVAASLVDLCGIEALEQLPGRWVFFDRDFTELFGDWQKWRGMKVSNLGFTHHLGKPSFFAPNHTQSADRRHKPFLDFPDTCGNPDT